MKGRSLSFDPPSITLALELRAFLKGKKSDLGVGLKQGAWQRLLAVLRKAATRCPAHVAQRTCMKEVSNRHREFSLDDE